MSRFNNEIISSSKWQIGDIIRRTSTGWGCVKQGEEYTISKIIIRLCFKPNDENNYILLKNIDNIYHKDSFEFVKRPYE